MMQTSHKKLYQFTNKSLISKQEEWWGAREGSPSLSHYESRAGFCCCLFNQTPLLCVLPKWESFDVSRREIDWGCFESCSNLRSAVREEEAEQRSIRLAVIMFNKDKQTSSSVKCRCEQWIAVVLCRLSPRHYLLRVAKCSVLRKSEHCHDINFPIQLCPISSSTLNVHTWWGLFWFFFLDFFSSLWAIEGFWCKYCEDSFLYKKGVKKLWPEGKAASSPA